jgi:hypothetical protein
MIKDTMKRKKPSFNEAYHGYRTFSELLEDAQKEGLVELDTDKRSRTYVVTRFGSELKSSVPAVQKKTSRRRRSSSKRRAAKAASQLPSAPAADTHDGLAQVEPVSAAAAEPPAEVPDREPSGSCEESPSAS